MTCGLSRSYNQAAPGSFFKRLVEVTGAASLYFIRQERQRNSLHIFFRSAKTPEL